MTEKPLTRLAINTNYEMFEKLLWEESQLKQTWGIYESFNFIVTAHHLYVDWMKPDVATPEQIARKRLLPQGAKDVFQAVLDISNGSKHWKISNPKTLENQVIIRVQEPVIGCWEAWASDSPMAYFRFTKYDMSMAQLSYVVVQYFDWILNGPDLVVPVGFQEGLDAMLAID
ncbi:hypothetical protein [Massilia oculi]|uniref:hypothetical protein n=1 Tax=Massilia oculi TaxID=945844 RepID=UPI001AAE2717|nr:hypothetical protein [Massilia oculi]